MSTSKPEYYTRKQLLMLLNSSNQLVSLGGYVSSVSRKRYTKDHVRYSLGFTAFKAMFDIKYDDIPLYINNFPIECDLWGNPIGNLAFNKALASNILKWRLQIGK